MEDSETQTKPKKIKFIKPDRQLSPKIRQFQIVGRAEPKESNPNPKLFRMRLFARNEVVAKSRFWYYMSRINKIKKSRGQVLELIELHERKPKTVKNFGIWLRYNSRRGTHNMYKEFRDISQAGAVEQMICDMSGSHAALTCNIEVIRILELKDEECKRPAIIQLHGKDLKFPMIRHLPMIPHGHRRRFLCRRPTTYYK